MFCPKCGLRENQETQYCRACGADLSAVRDAVTGRLQPGDAVHGARHDIAKAFAAKIQTLKSAKELKKVTNEVLPEIEKFLESPAEKRLRRIRNGSLISMIGLGTAIGFIVAGSLADPDLFVVAALGFVAFFIGIAFLLNGFFFTIHDQPEAEGFEKPEIEKSLFGDKRNTSDLLMPPSARSEFTSVTENTTRTLEDKIPVSDTRDKE